MKLFPLMSAIAFATVLAGCDGEEAIDPNSLSPAEMYTMSKAYFIGDGVIKDEEKAVELCKHSADLGYPQAQYYMGFLYASGNSVEQNFNLATEYYRKAADQGIVEAQSMLGETVYKSSDLTVNKKDAVKYLVMSANHDPESMTELAKIYLDGEILEKDVKKAFALLNNAADYKYVPSLIILAKMYFYGNFGIVKDYYKGNNFLSIALAQDDNTDALILASEVYFAGLGKPQNSSKALELLTKASDQGALDASERLAVYYFNEEDYATALFWFDKLANAGIMDAQVRLADMYQKGLGTEKNEELALKWYEQARELGYKDSDYLIAVLSAHNPTKQDQAVAIVETLREKADQNDQDSLQKLYYFYGDTQGINQEDKTKELLEKIKNFGDFDLIYKIGSDHMTGSNGLKADQTLGRDLITLSAEYGYADGAYMMGKWQEEGLNGKPNKITAYVWYSIAASSNSEAKGRLNALKLNRREKKNAQVQIVKLKEDIENRQKELSEKQISQDDIKENFDSNR